MVHAFIMVKTGAGESERLLAAVRDVESVAECHIVAGDYDVIAEVDVSEIYDVFEVVSSRIQGIEGVSETKTYIAME